MPLKSMLVDVDTVRFTTFTLAEVTRRFDGVTVAEIDRDTSIGAASPPGEVTTTVIASGELPVNTPASGIVRVNVPPFAGSAVVAPLTESLPSTTLPLLIVMTANPFGEALAALGRRGSNV